MSRIRTNLVLALLVLVSSLAVAGTAPAATPSSITLAPARVLSFDWLRGQPSWQAGSLDRLRRSAFVLQAGGGFAMLEPDGYPTLRGRATASNGVLSIQGSYRFQTYGGLTTVDVSGTVPLRGTPILTLHYTAAQSVAANPLGKPIGYSNVKYFRARLLLRRI